MVAVSVPARSPVPVITITLVTITALVFWTAQGNALLVYDREKILAGEIWRLVSGHLVHFSWQHLGYNLALFTVAGCWLEYRSGVRYLWLVVLTALVGSLYFLVFMPDMASYGGLSGIVSASIVFLALLEIQQNRKTRPIWVMILLLFLAKTGYELLSGKALFVAQDATAFEVVPAAHIVGAIIAVILFYLPEKPGA